MTARPSESGTWRTPAIIGGASVWTWQNRAAILDRVTGAGVAGIFTMELRETESGDWELVTCASNRHATRYRRYRTAGDAARAGYAWLDRRFTTTGAAR